MNNKKITIELFSIIKDLIKNAWVVLLAVLVGYMGIYIVSHSVYKPEYTASATLVVNNRSVQAESISQFQSASEMAAVFSNVFTEPIIKQKAAAFAEKSGFNGKLTASVLPDTNFLEVKVTSDSPQTSYELLTAVLEVYPEVSGKVFKNAVITVLSFPEMPHGTSNNIVSENKSVIISACIAISVFLILVASVMRDTVKNEQAFKEKIDSKLLGVIPHENKKMTVREIIDRKKKSLLIYGNTLVTLGFSEAYQKIAAKLEYMKHHSGDNVFAVTSVAENEGKSTAASNIAIALAKKNKRVILLDLDGKKPALYKIFEEQYIEQSELGELFEGKLSYGDFRLRKYKKIPLYLALNTKVHENYYQWIRSGEVERILNVFKNKVDYIIVDTAPLSADASVTDIAKFVDKTILIVRNDVVRASAINDAVITIEEVGGKMAGCILNDTYPESLLGGVKDISSGGYYYSKKYGSKYGYYNTEKADHGSEENELVGADSHL
ncbi:MAG: AAA family ATPase [Clostridia bacterium]|nr:AAA family ATPase [Clostridia bacterium]